MTRRALLLGSGAAALFLAALLTLVYLLSRLHLPLGRAGTVAGNTYLSIVFVLIGAVMGSLLLSVLCAVVISDWRVGQPFSRLLAPIFATTAGITATTFISSLIGLDLLRHHLHQHWSWLYQPEVRILNNLILLAVFASLGWKIQVLLSGRGLNQRTVVALIGSGLCLVALILLAAIVL